MTICFCFGFLLSYPDLLTPRSDTPSLPMFLLDPDLQCCLSLEIYSMYSFYSHIYFPHRFPTSIFDENDASSPIVMFCFPSWFSPGVVV